MLHDQYTLCFQFENVVTKGNEPLVHHMELFHCEGSEKIPLYRGPCDATDRPLATQVCKKVLAAWAMGATPFYYPEVRFSPYEHRYKYIVYLGGTVLPRQLSGVGCYLTARHWFFPSSSLCRGPDGLTDLADKLHLLSKKEKKFV